VRSLKAWGRKKRKKWRSESGGMLTKQRPSGTLVYPTPVNHVFDSVRAAMLEELWKASIFSISNSLISLKLDDNSQCLWMRGTTVNQRLAVMSRPQPLI
jgi:hypothetical protein